MAHTRLCSARWPEPLTAPGAAQACPSCLPSPANQLTCQADPRLGRPLKKGKRFAPRHSSNGGCTRGRPAAFPSRTPAMAALIGHRRAGSPRLRPLAPLPSTSAPNQRTFAEQPGCARPSSPSPERRLRTERIGGVTSFDPSSGVPGNGFRASFKHPARPFGLPHILVHFPLSNDREQSDFPGGNHIALAAQKSLFSACQARSETKSIFSPNPKILNPIN